MVHEDFIDAVARRARVSADQVTTITRATLETLADRVSGGQANDLAKQLPEGLDDHLRKPRENVEPFGLVEFVQRITARAGVDDVLASAGAHAVLAQRVAPPDFLLGVVLIAGLGVVDQTGRDVR
ncbi:DUF2267 domain-containing protein [Micromonospora sp. DT47]|uniref:DUF2267 domain-containing protein n=1 Tax=Micromonospora sp. DT47 TaxID=3393431 RepID=UPI003CF6B468